MSNKMESEDERYRRIVNKVCEDIKQEIMDILKNKDHKRAAAYGFYTPECDEEN